MFSRYAIFATFPPGPLSDALAAWLGWDSAAGQVRAQPDLPVDIARLTERPRKYGAHGTIKAPFRLAPGADATALNAALRAHCANRGPVDLGRLKPARFHRFFALTPAADIPDLDRLAAETVAGLDAFRAPSTAAELDKRRRAPLTPRQEEHLGRWGYPHVMRDFSFHVTLTGPVPEPQIAQVETALAAHLGPYLKSPLRLDALTLLGEHAETGFFHVIDRIPLGPREAG